MIRWLSLWGPVFGFMAAVIWLSDDASIAAPEMLSDKLLHLLAFFLFGLACMRAFHGGWRLPQLGPSLAAMALAIGFGAFDEWRQTGVLARHADLADWVADSAGAVLSWLTLRFWPWRSPRATEEKG